MNRNVTLVVDGSPQQLHTRALTVRGALRSAGYTLTEGDEVQPAGSTWLGSVSEIRYTRAGSIFLWVDPAGSMVPVNPAERTPAGILSAAGFEYHDADGLKLNGRTISLTEPLPETGRIVLQYSPAVAVTVNHDGQESVLRTSAGWLGKALWLNDVQLRGANLLTESFDRLLDEPLNVSVTPAIKVTVQADGKEFTSYVPEGTVGQALSVIGASLQDLDYSLPAETEPLPADGKIKVVRVREEIIREQTAIPFPVSQTNDVDLPVGEVKVITPGVPGLQQVTVLVRYENGKEVKRTTEDAVVLKEPVAQEEVVGSKFIVQTMNTPYGPISYYRTVTVWATSYSPCRSGADRCYYGTSSGAAVQKGIIGVTRAWYSLFKGDQLYVPGYGIGTIADVGGGISGKYWIDLGYSDSDWEQWSQYITVYFLTPVPDYVPAVLP